MPRAKNDPFKRNSAQALNHMAAAILDVNNVYNAFNENLQKLKEVVETDNKLLAEVSQMSELPIDQTLEFAQAQEHIRNYDRYKGYVHDLETIMLGVNACREHLLLFTSLVWNLDEESIKVYLG